MNLWEGNARLEHLNDLMRNVPDFPKPGILFKDITPMMADPKALHVVIDAFSEHFIGDHIDAVVGIESRGFIFGAALALRLNAGFVPVRKPGKLPAAVDKVAYILEYGSNELEMHKDALKPGAKVVIVDDLLATGGTAAATVELIKKQGGVVEGFCFVVELSFLNGRNKLDGAPIFSLLRYGADE